MAARHFSFILFILLSPAFCLAAQTDETAPPQTARRIRDVESSLQALNPAAGDPQQAQKLHTLAERMGAANVPGVSIAVIDQLKIEWVKGYGILKAGGTAPVTPESLFEAASTSKLVTAVMVLRAVEQGKLDLDADVNSCLRSWKVPENEFTREQKVTLRRLLTHQAGLPATNFPYDETAGTPTLVQVLRGEAPARNKPAAVELVPGSKWRYSNIGYVVIQQVLEDIFGRPFAELAREMVFQPLKMDSSTFVCPLPPAWRSREAVPHDAQGTACEPAMHPVALAQGGLMTTPADLARLTIELMRAGRGESGRLLSAAAARQMLRSEVDLDPRLFGVPASEGLGVFLLGKGEGLSFAHPGSNYPGATSWLIGYPEKGQGVIIMTNGVQGELLALELMKALARLYGWPFGQ
jgi:CubicO group peptidase (beta-lactamase class C family)